jgi:pimeloyl-ACP methyl ester carboxylesterase
VNNIDALKNIRIVLARPSHPGNIGATARAMKTMGLSDLRLVLPRHFPHPDALARAAGASDILENAKVVDSVSAALDGCVLVGHSYGGNVISGVADRLRDRVGHYVFLDAGVPPDDHRTWKWSAMHAPATRAARLAQIRDEGRGLFLPAPPAHAAN